MRAYNTYTPRKQEGGKSPEYCHCNERNFGLFSHPHAAPSFCHHSLWSFSLLVFSQSQNSAKKSSHHFLCVRTTPITSLLNESVPLCSFFKHIPFHPSSQLVGSICVCIFNCLRRKHKRLRYSVQMWQPDMPCYITNLKDLCSLNCFSATCQQFVICEMER